MPTLSDHTHPELGDPPLISPGAFLALWQATGQEATLGRRPQNGGKMPGCYLASCPRQDLGDGEEEEEDLERQSSPSSVRLQSGLCTYWNKTASALDAVQSAERSSALSMPCLTGYATMHGPT